MSTRFFDPGDRLPDWDENAFTQEELIIMVDMVRESTFSDDHTGKPIDDRLTELFGFPAEWAGFQGLDGTCYVNAYGAVETDDGRDELDLQFELSDDLTQFTLTAMRINGEEQDERFIAEFEGQFY